MPPATLRVSCHCQCIAGVASSSHRQWFHQNLAEKFVGNLFRNHDFSSFQPATNVVALPLETITNANRFPLLLAFDWMWLSSTSQSSNNNHLGHHHSSFFSSIDNKLPLTTTLVVASSRSLLRRSWQVPPSRRLLFASTNDGIISWLYPSSNLAWLGWLSLIQSLSWLNSTW